MAALKVCSRPDCPELTPKGMCSEHRAEAEQRRGNRHARGYDSKHVAHRAALIAQATPNTLCARCGQPLGEGYRSAHDDHTDDRTGYLGLSHPACDSAAGARKRWGGG